MAEEAKTPDEWADELLRQTHRPERWRHELAAHTHGWKEHAYETGEPIKLTLAAYKAAIAAATANPRTTHAPALSQYARAAAKASDKRAATAPTPPSAAEKVEAQ